VSSSGSDVLLVRIQALVQRFNARQHDGHLRRQLPESLADAEADTAFFKTLAVGLLTELGCPRATMARVVRADAQTLRQILLDALAHDAATYQASETAEAGTSRELLDPAPTRTRTSRASPGIQPRTAAEALDAPRSPRHRQETWSVADELPPPPPPRAALPVAQLSMRHPDRGEAQPAAVYSAASVHQHRGIDGIEMAVSPVPGVSMRDSTVSH
jgi:hypothetical protein